jgi:hypothetical protein
MWKWQGYEIFCGKLVKIATLWSGVDVKLGCVQDLEAIGIYDGIWACASLLHVPADELQSVFSLLARALTPGGTLYCSFKHGEFEGIRDGRYFTDLTEAGLTKIVDASGLAIVETRITNDVRPEQVKVEWLNAIMVRNCG